MDPERALISSSDNRKREVLAPWSSTRSRPLQQALVPFENGAEGQGLLIIPGSGRSHELHPTILHRRPRSRAMNLALLSLAGLLALVVLYAATPLTAGAALQLNNFAAGTNIFKIPPTPTRTPTPTPPPVVSSGGGGTAPNPGSSAIISEINSVFGSYGAGAVNVATCESGLNPNAYNGISIMGSHAEGIFQILYPSTWDTTSESGQSPYNADANILAAHQMFVRDGYSWREWVCQP